MKRPKFKFEYSPKFNPSYSISITYLRKYAGIGYDISSFNRLTHKGQTELEALYNEYAKKKLPDEVLHYIFWPPSRIGYQSLLFLKEDVDEMYEKIKNILDDCVIIGHPFEYDKEDCDEIISDITNYKKSLLIAERHCKEEQPEMLI